MTATLSAGAGVHDYLARQVEALHRLRKPARRAEADAVHQMRVATRRLRSLLSAYGDLYAEIPVSRQRLRWLAGVLGEVRDLEVLRMRFAEHLGQDRPQWFDELAEAERRAYGRLGKAFDRKRYAALIDAAERMAGRPHFSAAAVRPAADVLSPIVRAARLDLADAFGAIATADDPDAARHRARKTAKRTRYTAEAAAKALGDEAAAPAAEAKRLQTVCGRYQDCVVAIAYIESHTKVGDARREEVLEAERRSREAQLDAVERALAV
ncbi:CHAD domain-containing protein [Glycomyces sp. L485]|uniref:CHAD domain-containing protein n=1 Tax=Glycomyces sp. L485 TaxID=2909235 RepID=UPI001F4BCB9C|nr:CHAD domain-containing protein [Glycomyces sp. L485]MCH7231634.1 CHAD domain-containing protein [Glycomyces sp. L485]